MAAQIARTYLENHLVNLRERNNLSRALVSSSPKRQLNSALQFDFLLVTAFEVTLGAEHVRVVPEYVFSQEHRDPVDIHGSLSGNEKTFNRFALRWHNFRVP